MAYVGTDEGGGGIPMPPPMILPEFGAELLVVELLLIKLTELDTAQYAG